MNLRPSTLELKARSSTLIFCGIARGRAGGRAPQDTIIPLYIRGNLKDKQSVVNKRRLQGTQHGDHIGK
jgi:hypothetical protein